MREFEFKTKVCAYQAEELPEEYKLLITKAKDSTQNSYSPYSHFAVGAAVLLEDGEILCGANQENAAYPSGLCAERTVLFYANASHPHTPVKALAIAGFTDGHFTHEPVSPCGACRQVMAETEHIWGKPLTILLYGEKEVYLFEGVESLLPYSFVSDNLEG